MYGSAPVKAGLSVHETGKGKYRETRFVFDGMEVTMVDAAGTIAYGSQKIYDFLEGVVEVLGSRGKLTRVERTAAGFEDAFDGDFAVGTVAAAADNNLTSTEANIVPKTATAQASSGVSAGGAAVATTRAGTLDGSATPVDLYLNLIVDDDDHDITTTPSNLKVWGEVVVQWIDVGDNA